MAPSVKTKERPPVKQRPDSQDFEFIFLNDTPLMDVRAPVEFDKGAFPQSVNRPLLDDEQRRLIGIRYREHGQDAAIALGLELATPEIRQQRMDSWLDFIQQHPEGYLYCFRGGLRSRTTQQWIAEAGVDYPLVTGGYKAMRRYLIDTLEANCATAPLVLVSGRTGTGKTRVLHQIQRQVDLEGLANHRGSAFGRRPGGQPSQINFENAVSVDLLKQMHQRPAELFIEDESRLVGRCYVPDCLQEAMKRAPMVVLESAIEEREQIALEDYVLDLWPEYQTAFGAEAAERFAAQILDNLSRIKKRLGGERYQYLHDLFADATDAFLASGDADGFREGIRYLLTEYYDPMYDYMLSKREGKILFRGEAEAVVEYANRDHG